MIRMHKLFVLFWIEWSMHQIELGSKCKLFHYAWRWWLCMEMMIIKVCHCKWVFGYDINMMFGITKSTVHLQWILLQEMIRVSHLISHCAVLTIEANKYCTMAYQVWNLDHFLNFFVEGFLVSTIHCKSLILKCEQTTFRFTLNYFKKILLPCQKVC